MDIRSEAASYYDLNPSFPEDIPFYLGQIPTQESRVLELGCGTGRVTISLAAHCRQVVGIDLSEAMVAICRQKLQGAGIPAANARVEVGDITKFTLPEKFDLIIAPFRVFQNLESDRQVAGLFSCVRQHLAPGGRCILNVFRPYGDPDMLRRKWCSNEENLNWEVAIEGGKVTCHDRRPRMDPDRLVVYPELIYRRYLHDQLVDESVLKIAMRCYYADDFLKLVEVHGFQVQARWGGYAGEVYGEGPELVLAFGL